MKMGKRLKIVWVCAFSNNEVRRHYRTNVGFLMKMVNKLLNGKTPTAQDYGVWNTHGIAEMEKRDDVELHILSPIRYLAEREKHFEINGVYYHYFRDENSTFFRQIGYQLFTKNRSLFKRNRAIAKQIINNISPDVVHVIGAENPYYSTVLLDVPKNIITIVQLQTLLSKAVHETEVTKEKKSFEYKSRIEKMLFDKADYIGTNVTLFMDFIKKHTNSKVEFLKLSLALTEPVDFSYDKKEFDFVYFAAGIQKAVDVAIEAFALAHEKNPSLTLDVVGGYTVDLKSMLDNRLRELGIENSVTFEGKLATHEDVLRQIKKSRFALLPLKMDVIPGTVREAMAKGLPVVTTITENGTPTLNEKRESVLLSAQGDYQAMADNMLKLVNDPEYAKTLQTNAGLTASERMSNKLIIDKWVEAYYACIEFSKNGAPIPNELIA